MSSQVLGTGIAQVLPFLATPLLTRLYSQDDFAAYTEFFALATILAVAAGGKYPVAIVLPKLRSDALRLLQLSFYLTIAYSILLCPIVAIVALTGLEMGSDLVYFVPLYVLFFGLWTGMIHWSIRDRFFRLNAAAKVLQSVGYVAAALLIGLLNSATYGLVIAKILGLVLSFFFLVYRSALKFRWIAWEKLTTVRKRYIDYPKYGIVPALLNTISAQALILFLSKEYSTQDLGDYGLTYMVLSAPLGLIGTSFKDVFYERTASLINREAFMEVRTFFKKSALLLAALGAVIALILIVLGPELFSFVFGEQWERAGTFAAILAISFLFKLVASPLSSVFNAANKLKIASVWQTTYFVTTFGTLALAVYVFEVGITSLLKIYVIHEVILYSTYLLLEYWMLRQLKSTR